MKYHIVGYIAGEKKNPPRFLVAANPIKEKKFFFFKSKPKVNFNIDKNTICFVLPYSMEWFDVIDKHQCDKDEGIVVEWEPNMNDYVSSPQILSGETHEGWMHKELIKQQEAANAARVAKEKEIAERTKRYYLPPFKDYRYDVGNILGHKVLLYLASVAIVVDKPEGGWTESSGGIEYFLFPAEKGKQILDEAKKLQTRKHEYWNPNLEDYYEGEIGMTHPVFGESRQVARVSKLLPDVVLNNLHLLQI